VLKPGGRIYGSASYLEPSHDKCMYFAFNSVGMRLMLNETGYSHIEIKSGINAFSLILRNLLIRMLPRKLGEQMAFCLAYCIVAGLIYTLLICRAIISFIKRGHLSDDCRNAYAYISKKAPMDFAGHIQFIAEANK